jgi:hypothetical protein
MACLTPFLLKLCHRNRASEYATNSGKRSSPKTQTACIPASEIADCLGSAKLANVVMMGRGSGNRGALAGHGAGRSRK